MKARAEPFRDGWRIVITIGEEEIWMEREPAMDLFLELQAAIGKVDAEVIRARVRARKDGE